MLPRRAVREADDRRRGRARRARRRALAGHDVSRELLLDHLYVHAGVDVARHLARVAAGLDSLVLGESEILGQVGDALEAARVEGTVGPGIALLFRSAISTGRRARAETALGANPATASSMALALAAGVLGDLRGRSVLVVGAGRIGLADAQGGRGSQDRSLAVANRTEARAPIAQRFGATAAGLDDLESTLAGADVVVSATCSETPRSSARAGRASHCGAGRSTSRDRRPRRSGRLST